MLLHFIQAIHRWATGVATSENSIQENPKGNENRSQSLTRMDKFCSHLIIRSKMSSNALAILIASDPAMSITLYALVCVHRTGSYIR